jgi:hypothetical protein
MTRAHRVSAFAAALLLAACAGGSSGPIGGRSGGAAQGPARAAYAAQARAKVYSEPSFTANVVGVLTRHEKLDRFQSDGGFAYVRAEGIAGWIPENQLVEKLPARRPPPAATTTPEPSVAPAEETPPPEAPPPPEDSEAESPAPEPERSVFDPY